MTEGGICAQGVGKQFRRYDPHRPRSLRRLLTQAPRLPRRADKFWALQDIDLTVAPGEMVGVVGRNGSGKSTLLRLVGGVLRPDAGALEISGRIGGLLDLNVGMHEELSGRDNALIGSVIAGLTRREAERRLPQIIEFSQLGEHIDAPVRTYSSGMKLRLGFATAIHAEPDVLLIDEVLSVGDMAFQARCYERIRKLRERGMAILLVTHDMSQVEKLCDRAVWLDRGTMVAEGEPKAVTLEYTAKMHARTMDSTPTNVPTRRLPGGIELKAGENRFGSQEYTIDRLRLTDRDEVEQVQVRVGDPLLLHIEMSADSSEVPIVGVSLTLADDPDATAVLDLNTQVDEVAPPNNGERGKLRLEIDRLDLPPGDYLLSIGLYAPNWEYAYDFHWRSYPLTISGQHQVAGVLNPPRRWVFG